MTLPPPRPGEVSGGDTGEGRRQESGGRNFSRAERGRRGA